MRVCVDKMARSLVKAHRWEWRVWGLLIGGLVVVATWAMAKAHADPWQHLYDDKHKTTWCGVCGREHPHRPHCGHDHHHSHCH